MASEQKPHIPEFVSRSLAEKALRNGLNDATITVTAFSVTMGTSAGDNYCSEIYRAKVGYMQSGVTQEISLIIKAMPFLEHRGPPLEELQFFDKEVDMYTNVIPQLSQLLNDEFLCAK